MYVNQNFEPMGFYFPGPLTYWSILKSFPCLLGTALQQNIVSNWPSMLERYQKQEPSIQSKHLLQPPKIYNPWIIYKSFFLIILRLIIYNIQSSDHIQIVFLGYSYVYNSICLVLTIYTKHLTFTQRVNFNLLT